MITPKPELLAPAGTYDAFIAALTAGADAVYLGVEDFNARRNATNFTLEEFSVLCDLAHTAGRRIYLTLNTVILPEEMSAALEVAHKAWEAGADALIVQDLGLLTRIARELPDFELHASTQMNLHSGAGVRLVAELGAARVTLARELSLDEIAKIATLGVPLEVFAHGALCVCYSGQCLFSSLVGRRSANRGLCAQACRLPYSLIDTSTGKRVKTSGEHLLSPADLSTIDILPALVETTIVSLKIEGRMKSAPYVATVTRTYRKALDTLCQTLCRVEDPSSCHCERSEESGDTVSAVSAVSALADESGCRPNNDLEETFSRGFTTAYLEGERGNDMMSYARPNNRGVALGRVTSLNNGIVGVEISKRVVKGDALEFRTSRGRSVVTLTAFWASPSDKGEPCEEASEGTRIYLRVPDPVSIGDRVFRVRSAELLDAAKSNYDNTVFAGNNGLVEIDAQVSLRIGEPLAITFATTDNALSATALGAPVEAARTKALAVDDVREHVGRVGGTPFTIRSWDIQLDEGVGIGFSALHKLRAEALEALTGDLLAPWQNRRTSPLEAPPALAPAQKGKPHVAAIVTDAAHAKAAVQGGAELVYLHSLLFEATDETGYPKLGKLPESVQVVRLLPTITHDSDLEQTLASVTPPVKSGPTWGAAVANNLGELKQLRNLGIPFEAGASLGIYNTETLNTLSRLGATQAWVSPELSLQDVALLSPTAPLPLALTIFGQQEVMVTEHCVLMAQGPCDQRCGLCARRKAPRLLEDRKGYRFPVRTDNYGRSHLYNAVPLDLTPSMPELVSIGISTLVVDGTLLTTKELKVEVERAVRARDLAVKGAGSLPKREGYTTGHFFRGVY